jgi:hypothetical protein
MHQKGPEMYYSEETLHNTLTTQNYALIERKPWNVREGDIMVLSDSSRYNMPTMYIPVEITITDKYPEFSNPYPYNDGQYARTSYRFYHKPLDADDIKYLHGRHSTERWNRFDNVEIYRKTT